jgi:hypothetical protein
MIEDAENREQAAHFGRIERDTWRLVIAQLEKAPPERG